MRIRVNAPWFPAAVCACMAYPLGAGAHEFWIEPSTFTPGVGRRVEVALRVGEHFTGEPVRRKADRIERFAAIRVDDGSSGACHESPIIGEEGGDPAGGFEPAEPGLYILIYDSGNAHIELECEQFDEYLKEKGLETIRQRRAERKENSVPAREIYSRCAKSLILAMGDDSSGARRGLDRAVGMPLELVARFDPFAHEGTQDARVQVLFEGKPLRDVQVTARSRRTPTAVQQKRSGGDGQVAFRLTDPGPWLIECTHMRPTPERNDADYESFWASLTFEAPRSPH